MLKAGWPARWHGGTYQAADGEVKFQRNDVAWKPTDSGRGFNIAAKDAVAGDEWLRYQHVVPSSETWAVLAKEKRIPPESEVPRRPQLISDFYAYNTNQDLNDFNGHPKAESEFAVGLGLHWVGDLLLECDVDVQEANAQSAIALELVEGSQVDAQGVRVPCRFQCRIDLTTGEATLTVLGIEDADWAKTKRTAKTSVRGPGRYSLRFSNFDDELRLWVNGSRVEFSAPTGYQFLTPDTDARNNRPTTADLAPAGINVEGATVTVDHLRVKRDIYYIATRGNTGTALVDYASGTALATNPTEITQREAMSDPRYFQQFEDVRTVEFTTGPDDFLALGDNSPKSMDSRLWTGEPFVPRRLLIGEALFIYWPHSWMFPVPNVKDMGFVR